MERVGNPNAVSFLEGLRGRDIDLILNVQGRILTQAAIAQLPGLILNRHSALLPHYRGVEPVFWALLNGEQRIGVSIHQLTAGVDLGAVYAQQDIAHEQRSVLEIYKDSFVEGGKLAAQVVRDVENGRASFTEQVAEDGSYYSLPNWREARSFRHKGLRYI